MKVFAKATLFSLLAVTTAFAYHEGGDAPTPPEAGKCVPPGYEWIHTDGGPVGMFRMSETLFNVKEDEVGWAWAGPDAMVVLFTDTEGNVKFLDTDPQDLEAPFKVLVNAATCEYKSEYSEQAGSNRPRGI